MSFDAWGKRREEYWTPMTDAAIASYGAFTALTTTRGFTGHEEIDPVGLIHMNGRVYDPEIGRFLSADPFVQETHNLQSWNRYSYVLNNPLSYTDPSGFFFSKLFKSIGKALGSLLRGIGNVLKQVLKSPIFRAIAQIVGCAAMAFNPVACSALSSLMTLASGGSVADALKAFVISFAQIGIFSAVGPTLNALQAGNFVLGTVVKAGVHGIIGGAASVAQGGSFLQGFAGGAMGAIGGAIAGSGLVGKYGDGIAGNQLARALISGAAGCAGALLTGGKCAQAAVTAAFASLYNGDGDHGARAGTTRQYSASGSATAFSTWWGMSGSLTIGLSVPENWTYLDGYQLFFGGQANALVGAGLFAGFGVGGGYAMSDGPLTPGASLTSVLHGEAGVGMAPSVQVSVDYPIDQQTGKVGTPSLGFPIAPKVGAGYGAYGSLGIGLNGTYTTPTVGEMKSWLGTRFSAAPRK